MIQIIRNPNEPELINEKIDHHRTHTYIYMSY